MNQTGLLACFSSFSFVSGLIFAAIRKAIKMINITLPDGSKREVESGTTALDVAMSISEGLARNVLAAEVNGEVWDPQRQITSDATFEIAHMERR